MSGYTPWRGQPAGAIAPAVEAPAVKRDPLGIIYDSSRTDAEGTTHYTRNRAQGSAEGPAQWSSEHDCNPICGHHLSAKCLGCNVCLECDGCYCREGYDE